MDRATANNVMKQVKLKLQFSVKVSYIEIRKRSDLLSLDLN